MSLSLGRNETAAELHQNLTDGEVVRIEKVRLDGRRTKYWMGRSETELSSGSCHKQKNTPQNEKMHWHCVFNTPPHPQDTFYIAINSAILAAGNKKERRKPPPPSCFIHVLASWVAPISPAAGRLGAGVRGPARVCLPLTSGGAQRVQPTALSHSYGRLLGLFLL